MKSSKTHAVITTGVAATYKTTSSEHSASALWDEREWEYTHAEHGAFVCIRLSSAEAVQQARHTDYESGHLPSRDVTHGLYMHATHCLCWSGYRWHQYAILMSLLWCRVQIAAAIELIEEVCQHSWLVSPTRWVTVVDWLNHFCHDARKHSVICIMVRRMNIWTDKQTQLTFPTWVWARLCSPQQ